MNKLLIFVIIAFVMFLSSASQFEIEKLFEFLQSNKNIKIKITGHTDNVGADNDNLKLSELRAKAVLDALIKKGIDQARLSYEGKGKSMPIADNSTADGRKANRRTEFVVIQ